MPPQTAQREAPKEERHNLRRADILDIESIVQFLVGDNLDAQNNLDSWLPKDRETVKNTFWEILGPHEKGIVWVTTYRDKEGREFLTGIMALRLEGVWWSKEMFLSNLVFYVNPLYRSYGLADRLMKIAVEFSEKSGFPFVGSTFQYTDQVDLLERYFKRKGFDKLGSVLVYAGGK